MSKWNGTEKKEKEQGGRGSAREYLLDFWTSQDNRLKILNLSNDSIINTYTLATANMTRL